ncbi:MAG: transposase [Rhodocyclales bacterium CG_4_9_14_3_um_filter_68_10]|nr:MAG: transposase [Rhodocyclales bacterium CG_4_9_14_3_um_filter_68_10]
MVGQAQIQRRLSAPESIERVRELMAPGSVVLRTELADLVCAELGFVDRRGRLQRSGCLKALRVLEGRGLLTLPAAQTRPGSARPRRLDSKVPLAEDVPEQVDKVRGLELVPVDSEELMRVWNSLLIDEHPRGAGPLVGRQLRYLVGSEHGWLGALGFASAALHLQARDRWIGWDLETRRAQLDRVVGLSRFLIRPSVQCRNLASRVLGLAMARLTKDFEHRYGYQPWLVETFVDTTQFTGTCYQAANWIRVGSSQGRGRQDREGARALSIKDIYVHVLTADFRERLGLGARAGLGPLPLNADLDPETWAEQEFGGAPLGDLRLSRRLVQSATLQASGPMGSFPDAAGGDRAVIKGHYRLLDQPDDSAVTLENILAPHRQQTLRRMQAERTVLCVHDGTDLDYNGAAECEGLGVIGTNQTGAKSRGLHLHSTLAVTEQGLPLGVLSTRCNARQGRPQDDERGSAQVPIEEKKSYDWILALRDCEAVAAQMPHTRLVQVMDREADFFELFDEWRQGARRTELLIRAKHNRRTTTDVNLFDAVRTTEAQLQFQLHVGRQSARPKKSKQKARPMRAERIAEMTLRYQQVLMPAPNRMRDREPVSLWIVHAVEGQPPTDVKPVEWFLLTTMAITSPEQAERVLAHYCLRWRIEDWHRVLKSGCGIEELRNESAHRLERAIAIYLVIAWRVMLMALLGREEPGLPPEVLFSDIEIKVLTAFANSRRDLKPPERLGEAVRLVARLGGYQDRKRDPPPGHQIIWTGYSKLRAMCEGFLLARQHGGGVPP